MQANDVKETLDVKNGGVRGGGTGSGSCLLRPAKSAPQSLVRIHGPNLIAARQIHQPRFVQIFAVIGQPLSDCKLISESLGSVVGLARRASRCGLPGEKGTA